MSEDQTQSTHRPTFKGFSDKISNGDIRGAAIDLEELLNLQSETAERAALHYAKQFLEDSNIFMKTMKIYSALKSNNNHEALTLISQHFGLSGQNATDALEFVRKSI